MSSTPPLFFKLGNETTAPARRVVAEEWLGVPIQGAMCFVPPQPTSATGKFLDAGWATGRLRVLDLPVEFAVPLTPVDGSRPAADWCADALAGKFDVSMERCAQQLQAFRADRDAHVIVRLGWEHNGGTNYPWSNVPAEVFVNLYERAARIFRAVAPRVRLDWNLNALTGTADAARARFPARELVDRVSLDVYWHSQWQSDDPAKAWTMMRTGEIGLDWVAKFAADRDHLPLAIGECGVAPNGGPFVDGLAAWIADHPLESLGVWDDSASYGGRMSNGMSGTTGVRFVHHFGAPAKVRQMQETAGRIEGKLASLDEQIRHLGDEMSILTAERDLARMQLEARTLQLTNLQSMWRNLNEALEAAS